MTSLGDLPELVLVRIEVPRWGVVKPRADGRVDFLSPLPCPYNYGCIPGLESADGDPLDAVVLGPRLAPGREVRVQVRAVMGFVDAGRDDPKVICSAAPLSAIDRRGLEAFFAIYALAKRALNRLRGAGDPTRCTGWLPSAPRPRAGRADEAARLDRRVRPGCHRGRGSP